MAGGEGEATPPKKSDLGVRTMSAVVMLAVSGTALWLGGWWWTVFVAAVALGVLWEWWGLSGCFSLSTGSRIVWVAAGMIYVGLATGVLVYLRAEGVLGVLAIMLAVIATDVGAYFAGRAIGGAKIAPSISPSKTWAGLIGGMLAAGVMLNVVVPGLCYDNCPTDPWKIWVGHLRELQSNFSWPDTFAVLGIGALIAVIAQSGDFFESWMKRRAGVKDLGTLIPGHGGLFDRVDGLLAVCFVLGLFMMVSRVLG